MKLPKYFPPGYWLDRLLWTSIAISAAVLGFQSAAAWANRGTTWQLALCAGSIAVSLASFWHFTARRIIRDSKRWREVDRPAFAERVEIFRAAAERVVDEVGRRMAEEIDREYERRK